jgi:DNA-directed RNA polymerase subunit M/transcription elongation factor TFIIS
MNYRNEIIQYEFFALSSYAFVVQAFGVEQGEGEEMTDKCPKCGGDSKDYQFFPGFRKNETVSQLAARTRGVDPISGFRCHVCGYRWSVDGSVIPDGWVGD